MPGEQEPHVLGRADRLDLAAQAGQRIAVNPGQQTAFAPLLPAIRGRAGRTLRGFAPALFRHWRRRHREPAAQHEAFPFERGERPFDRGRRRPEVPGQPHRRYRPQSSQPAAEQFLQRILRRRGRDDTRSGIDVDRGIRSDGLHLRHVLRGDPQTLGGIDGHEPPGPAFADERRQRFAVRHVGQQRLGGVEAERGLHFRIGQEAERDQRVVQRVRAFGVRPGFGADAFDRVGVQPAEVGRRGRVEPAPRRNRARAPFFERGVVEKGVRLGVENFVGER